MTAIPSGWRFICQLGSRRGPSLICGQTRGIRSVCACAISSYSTAFLVLFEFDWFPSLWTLLGGTKHGHGLLVFPKIHSQFCWHRRRSSSTLATLRSNCVCMREWDSERPILFIIQFCHLGKLFKCHDFIQELY